VHWLLGAGTLHHEAPELVRVFMDEIRSWIIDGSSASGGCAKLIRSIPSISALRLSVPGDPPRSRLSRQRLFFIARGMRRENGLGFCALDSMG